MRSSTVPGNLNRDSFLAIPVRQTTTKDFRLGPQATSECLVLLGDWGNLRGKFLKENFGFHKYQKLIF